MENMVTITLNGVQTQAKIGTSILTIAREKNVYIPTLCYNDALAPYGACRICLVEIEKGDRKRVVTSCKYPVEDGLVINTDTERVIKTRNSIMELLLARAPKNKMIVELAASLGVTGGDLEDVNDECIMCGMCIRTCTEVVGVSALGFSSRGPSRMPTTPFAESSESCIGCGACVWICPTDYIKMEDKEGKRFIYNWKVELELAVCKKCNNFIAPKRQLEHFRKIADLPEDFFDLCWSCR
jgi:bidirectional [NiFe] hydrogenase diaphorase subunit